MDTDHDIVIATPIGQLYKATRGAQKTITTKSRKISDTIKDICNIDWQARFDILYDTIKDIQDTCQPLKTAKLKNDEAWMTPRINDEITERQKLYKLNNMVDRKKQFNRVCHLI
jgi:hypothetical protein